MTTEQDPGTITPNQDARLRARGHIDRAFAALNDHSHGDDAQGALLAAAQESLATARRMLDAIALIAKS